MSVNEIKLNYFLVDVIVKNIKVWIIGNILYCVENIKYFGRYFLLIAKFYLGSIFTI